MTRDEETPVAQEVRSQEELAITYPADNADFFTLAKAVMRNLPAGKQAATAGPDLEQWRRQTRRRLHEVVRPDPPLAVDEPFLALSTVFDWVEDVPGMARRLRVGGRWTLPVVEYTPRGSAPTGTTLILADGGRPAAHDLVGAALRGRRRAVVVDLLLTGECMPTAGSAAQWAMMIATLGRRPLGIQVSQLDAVVDWLGLTYPDRPRHIVTRGRGTGLTALAFAALHPGRVDVLELTDMDASLKDLLAKKVGYDGGPSMFCFGLLELVDVPELADLALPSRVLFRSPTTRSDPLGGPR